MRVTRCGQVHTRATERTRLNARQRNSQSPRRFFCRSHTFGIGQPRATDPPPRGIAAGLRGAWFSIPVTVFAGSAVAECTHHWKTLWRPSSGATAIARIRNGESCYPQQVDSRGIGNKALMLEYNDGRDMKEIAAGIFLGHFSLLFEQFDFSATNIPEQKKLPAKAGPVSATSQLPFRLHRAVTINQVGKKIILGWNWLIVKYLGNSNS